MPTDAPDDNEPSASTDSDDDDDFTERQGDPGRTGSFPLRLPAGQSEPIRGQGHFFSRRRARIRPRAVLARRKQASCNQTFAGGNPPRRNGKVLPTRAEGGATGNDVQARENAGVV